jgi:hypothetical protein
MNASTFVIWRNGFLALAPFLVAYWFIPSLGEIHKWGSVAILLSGALFAATIVLCDSSDSKGRKDRAAWFAVLGFALWFIFFRPEKVGVPSAELPILILSTSPILLFLVNVGHRLWQSPHMRKVWRAGRIRESIR